MFLWERTQTRAVLKWQGIYKKSKGTNGDAAKSPAEEQKPVDPEELIDMNTFDQLLDMDEEEDHEFSYSIVLNYFEQAEETFKDMDTALYVARMKGLNFSANAWL